MKKKEAGALLKQLILAKEQEQLLEGKLLKEHFHSTYEGLKLINIIKNTLKEVTSLPDIKTNVVNAAIGLTTGFITKKIFTGKSDNIVTKISGIILEMVIASKVTNNAEEIKSIAGGLLKKILNKNVDTEKVY